MRNVGKTGIWFSHHSKIVMKEKREKVDKVIFFLRTMLLLGCVIGLMLTVIGSLHLEVSVGKISAVLFLNSMILYIGMLCKKNKEINAVYLFLLVGSAVFFGKHLVSGGIAVLHAAAGQIEKYFGISYGFIFPVFEEKKSGLFIFYVFALMMTVCFRKVVYRTKNGLFMSIICIVLFMEVIIGSKLEGAGLYLMAGCLFILTVLKKRTEGNKDSVLLQAGICAGILVFLSVLVGGLFLGPELYKRIEQANQKVYDTVQEVLERLEGILDEKGISWQGWSSFINTMDGSLKNKLENDSDEIDLKVTFSEKPLSRVYVRGFTGDTYEGSYWHKIDHSEFKEVFPDKESGNQVQNILCGYIGNKGAPMEQRAVIEKIHARGDYGYIPYGFKVPDDVEGDGAYESRNRKIEYSGCVNWKEWAGTGAAPEEGSEIEQEYRTYVTSQYLKIPVNGLERLSEYCQIHAKDSVQEVIDFVVKDVKDGKPYSTDLQPVPRGKDFAEYFFFDQKKGFCIHYATTAVLMMRTMGVPARYVTGYVASPDDFAESENGYTAEIRNKQAHAWVEVYRSGKGWIPIETTPGYEEISYEQNKGERPQENMQQDIIPKETPAAEIMPTVQQTEVGLDENEENGMPLEIEGPPLDEHGSEETVKKTGSVLKKIFLGILAFAIIFIVIFFRRKICIERRKKRYYQKNINQGICEISYDIYQMLEDAGMDIYEKNDFMYAQKIEEKMKIFEEGEYQRIIDLAQKAAYGEEKLTEKEREECIVLYCKINKTILKNLTKFKRLWWKYIKTYDLA